jgi:hypothetical protein
MAGALLSIRDETLSGERLHEWALEFLTETLTVRELIRSRVYQEVQDHNLNQGKVFHGLVQPEESERAINGWKLKKARQLDWKRQFEKAIEAFEANGILILINDRQVETLDEEFDVAPNTKVSFIRLTQLVGG